jgi:hypothetical protein
MGCLVEYLDLRERKWKEDGQNCIMWSFITCTLYKYYYGDWIKEGYVACMRAMTIATFWSEILKGREHLADLCLDGVIIGNWKMGKYDVWMWAGLMCLNHRLTQKTRNFLSSWASISFSRRAVPSRVSLLVWPSALRVWHVLHPCTCGRNFAWPEYKEGFYFFL